MMDLFCMACKFHYNAFSYHTDFNNVDNRYIDLYILIYLFFAASLISKNKFLDVMILLRTDYGKNTHHLGNCLENHTN